MSTANDHDLLDYCPNCGSVGYPRLRKLGSTWVEVLLWLSFLLPGIVYSIWRASSKQLVCPKCEYPGTIPLDSPIAKAALGKMQKTSPVAGIASGPRSTPQLLA
jgi:hypothetical protein